MTTKSGTCSGNDTGASVHILGLLGFGEADETAWMADGSLWKGIAGQSGAYDLGRY